MPAKVKSHRVIPQNEETHLLKLYNLTNKFLEIAYLIKFCYNEYFLLGLKYPSNSTSGNVSLVYFSISSTKSLVSLNTPHAYFNIESSIAFCFLI